MKKIIYTSFFILLLSFTHTWATDDVVVQWGESSEVQLEQDFKLCFWNIHKIKHERSLRDLNELVTKADILLVQEVIESPELSEHFQGQFVRSWGQTGVATLSETRPVALQPLISRDFELGLFTPKAILISKYQWGDQVVTIANVHALNFVSHSLYQRQMDDLARELSRASGPVIVAGDFNTWNAKRLKYLSATFSQLGLSEVDFFTERPRDPRIGLFGLLDRAFVRGVQVSELEILDQLDSSDHLPSCALVSPL